MLTNREKRFIKYWEEQRAGGKWQYYLLYILAGTFISTLLLAFLIVMWQFRIPHLLLIAAVSFVPVTVATLLAWQQNEKKFKAIIRREVDEAKQEGSKGEEKPSV